MPFQDPPQPVKSALVQIGAQQIQQCFPTVFPIERQDRAYGFLIGNHLTPFL
jgi:hypothetical protein